MASYSADTNPFANLFLVVENGGQAPTLNTAGVSDQPRKKRSHRKSRQGCVACKRRKVKCDEQVPCSNCIRRDEKCLRLAQSPREPILPSLSSPKFEVSQEPELNLLHLELFSHFEKQTLVTLSFPEVWPVLMQQAFHEDFIMSAILCVSAAHLTVLNPRDARYSRASAQLLPKALRLLRQSLSHPFTDKNALALVGTSLLMSYISWSDLSFLSQRRLSEQDTQLDLSQDQLFLLSPGVLQVYFQALPILVAEGNGYGSMAHRRPRLRIERALRMHGENPARFVQAFMEIWDDPRYQKSPTQMKKAANCDSTAPRSWLYYLELKAKLHHLVMPEMTSENEMPSPTPVEMAKAIVELNSPNANTAGAIAHNDDITTNKITGTDAPDNLAYIEPTMNDIAAPPLAYSTSRSAYALMARRLSPLLCCISQLESSDSGSSIHSTLKNMKMDFRQMFFSFPVLYCWPFLELTNNGDSRALVILFHFYRAARLLLNAQDSWWSQERCRVMEELIFNELRSRGLDANLLALACP